MSSRVFASGSYDEALLIIGEYVNITSAAPPYQSGAFNASERKISKRGNAYLRKTGYEIMQSLIKHKPIDDPVYDFILKKRSEGKCSKEAMIAGLNKFLRVYYGKVMGLYSEH